MDFFNLPFEVKRGYSQRVGKDGTQNSGYVALEQERYACLSEQTSEQFTTCVLIVRLAWIHQNQEILKNASKFHLLSTSMYISNSYYPI